MPVPSSIQFNDDRGIEVQIPRYTKTVLALMISAAFSACALQTERSSSGPGASGRTTAPPVPPKAQEYEPAQYAEPPAVVAEPEVSEAPPPDMPEFEEEEEEVVEEAIAEDEEPIAVAEEPEPVVSEAPEPEMPQFVEEEQEPAEEVAEQFEPIAPPEEESVVTYEEEPGVAADDGIVAQQEYHEEEPGAAQDDGIVGRQEYYEEEAGVTADDGIIGQSQYYDEEGVEPEEGIVAQSQYYDEEEGAQAADQISEPQQSDEVMATEVEPETVAQQEEPTPVVLPVTITLEAEPWFDFDRSLVRSDAREKLDELLSGLQGVEYDTILVVGHADRIGTKTYNQALSERRANSVKSYLAGKDVPADRIKTEGRGEFEPSTDPNACTGMRKQRLIDCLQPDRRVEVTVTGQRMPQ